MNKLIMIYLFINSAFGFQEKKYEKKNFNGTTPKNASLLPFS